MEEIEPLHAVAGVKEIGYDAIKVNCGEAWPTAPDRFAADARARLRDAIQAAGARLASRDRRSFRSIANG